MDLSFVTDTKRFSRIVEGLRQAKKPITEEAIRAEYMEEEPKPVIASVEVPQEEPKEVPVPEKKPRAKKNA